MPLLLVSLIVAALAPAILPSPAAAAQAAAPGAQTAAPATYATEGALVGGLKSASGDTTGMQTSAIKNTDQYRINLVHRSKPAGAIAHTVGTEVHHITEGAATFVTGGTIVKGASGAATIKGGVSRRVTKGDVILIPENTPHWYSEIEGTITYLEVRFNVPAPK